MAKDSFDYFEAFKQLSAFAIEEVDVMIDCFKNFTKSEDVLEVMKRAHEIEHAGDEVNHAIFEHVATDFITPIEREDILSLAQSLDAVIDYLEDTIQRLYMFDVHVIHPDAVGFAEILRGSCVALNAGLGEFRNFKKSDAVKTAIVEVNSFEEQADSMYIRVTRDLYTNDSDQPVHVLKWLQIFNYLEKCADACEHAADSIRTTLLKNS